MPDVSTLYGDMNAYEFLVYMASLKKGQNLSHLIIFRK